MVRGYGNPVLAGNFWIDRAVQVGRGGCPLRFDALLLLVLTRTISDALFGGELYGFYAQLQTSGISRTLYHSERATLAPVADGVGLYG